MFYAKIVLFLNVDNVVLKYRYEAKRAMTSDLTAGSYRENNALERGPVNVLMIIMFYCLLSVEKGTATDWVTELHGSHQ